MEKNRDRFPSPVRNRSVMVIGGLDPTGGAGVVADLETLFSFKVNGSVVVTTLTAQNSKEVTEVLPVPTHTIVESVSKVLEEYVPDYIKIGLVGSSNNLRMIPEIVDMVRKRGGKGFTLLDPVICSSSGYRFVDDEGVLTMKERVIPCIDLLTPNIYEAQTLTGIEIKDKGDMERAGRSLLDMGVKHVIVKGGHLEEEYTDLYLSKDRVVEIKGSGKKGKKLRGSGCRFASAVIALLAHGVELELALKTAKRYIENLISSVS